MTDRPGGERMTEDTNGLSREQVEARLADALLRDRDVNLPFDDPLDVSIRDVVRAQTDTVVAMLTEACAEVDSRIRKAILQPHIRDSTEQGPDFCRTCSEAIHDWVTWPCAATELARAEAWPCDNYRAPTTCLTAPSGETGRCDWCRTQAEAAQAEGRRDALQAYVGPPPKCPGLPDCDGAGKWGATGRLPPGHLIHRHEHGAYLAHGDAPQTTLGQGEPGDQGEG